MIFPSRWLLIAQTPSIISSKSILSLIAFTSAVFGGIGNIPGAALGGMVIGLVAAFSDAYIGSKWTQVVIFGILIGVLVFRPTGLLGMRVPEK